MLSTQNEINRLIKRKAGVVQLDIQLGYEGLK